jgi:hypothetical protein
MKNLFFTLVLLFTVSLIFAQIPNASFENGDEESITGWHNIQGKTGTTTSYGFKTSLGDTIVNGRFAKLSYDGNNAPIIESKFAWDKRSSVLSGKFIYIPETSTQRFTIEITYLKWQPGMLRNDTVAFSSSSINPYNEQKFRNYDWFVVNIPIEKNGFRSNDNPDSCLITIKVDNGDFTNSNTVLLIDNLEFGDEVIASRKDFAEEQISIYPNPCSGNFKVEGIDGSALVSVMKLNGQEVVKTTASQISSVCLEKGVYLVSVETENQSLVKKLQVF